MNCYHPFGLTMGGISSKAAGQLENRYKFNDGTELENREFSDGSGLELYSTYFRGFDPQIGRFHQIDPLADAMDNQSPYVFADNNPTLLNDFYGLAADSTKPLPTVVLPEVVVTTLSKVRVNPAPTPAPEPAPLPAPLPAPEPAPPAPIPVWASLLKPCLTLGALFIPISTGQELSPMQLDKRLWDLNRYDPYPGYGNDKANTNNHIVYSFTFIPMDGKTNVIKYGISDEFRYSLERPERQLWGIQQRWGLTVKMQILTRTINREQAIEYEKQLVNQHFNFWKAMPREQIRPYPKRF